MSTRPGSRKQYSVIDDYDSESEYLVQTTENSQPSNELVLTVEKILGRKVLPNESNPSLPPIELFYIKWKGMSYLHASWETKEDIEKVDSQGKQKLKRFMLTPQPPGIKGEAENPLRSSLEMQNQVLDAYDDLVEEDDFNPDKIEYFNPEVAEVQRIIGCDNPASPFSKARSPQEILEIDARVTKALEEGEDPEALSLPPSGSDSYFVKWRGLPYNECSWELWTDLKFANEEVYRFWDTQTPPPGAASRTPHPSVQEYQKLEVSPNFGTAPISSSPSISSSSESSEQEGDGGEGGREGGLVLRDYQLEGVNWLLWNWWHKRPCILADEMGLGKTIQSVAFLHQLRFNPVTNVPGPFLIVAPLSLISQWHSELNEWSPRMNCIIHHGGQEARDTIVNYEFFYHEAFVPNRGLIQSLKRNNVCKFNVLLTTFEIAIKDIKLLSRINWKVLIVDEAHRLKNPSSRLFEQLRTLPHEHVLLLTGTPLQNKTEELWALLHFADKEKFKDSGDFLRRFGDLKEASQVAKLHSMLKPYLLRRVKEDVEKSLPPKEETIVEVSLTSIQKQFYRAIYEKNTVHLFRGVRACNQPSLMNVMMELRKCCNHPYLVRGVEDRILEDLPEPERLLPHVLCQKMIESSGKLVLLDKLLPKLFSQGHKVLIFSQMVRVLNILEDFMRFKGYSYERLDGSTRASDRNEAVERFCRPSLNRFIMLLSTKAGGLGLNLTAADTVIIFDSDWNPHNDIQAQARAHRIGQTRAVMVYRLLTRKTYEMHMFHQASLKLGLDRAVLAHARNELEDEYDAAPSKGKRGSKEKDPLTSSSDPNKLNLSVKEIDELLKRGAYDVFREDDTEQKEFVDADIDLIMQRSSHKVTYDGGANSGMASSMSSFSKASFVSADEKEDVDINDPDFWKKAVGLNDPGATGEEGGGTGLLDEKAANLPEQRVRKKTQVYGVDSVNNEQLEQFLKPVKLESKAARAAKGEKILRPQKEKAVTEILDLKKQQQDMMSWGPHARDRILRALNLFGFGRWERIRFESGGELRDLRDLEAYVRAYILQCGICASGQELSKADSDFVRDAINSAKAMDSLMKTEHKIVDVPPSLQEERFISKLKTGLAKKTLNRLDLLSRLSSLMQKGAELTVKLRSSGLLSDEESEDIDPNSLIPASYLNAPSNNGTAINIMVSSDVESLIASLPQEQLARCLPLGDVRPAWTRLEKWWDLQCDRHLLIGCFKYGYGRYELMRDDPALCFGRKIEAHAKEVRDKEAAEVALAEAALLQQQHVESSSEDLSGGQKRSGEEFEANLDGSALDDEDSFSAKRLKEGETLELPNNPHSSVVSVSIATKRKSGPGRGGGRGDKEKGHGKSYFSLGQTNNIIFSKFDPDSNSVFIRVALKEGRSCRLLISGSRSSEYIGVYPQQGSFRWVAIYNKAVYKYLGAYDSQIEAALEYDREARASEPPGKAICNFTLTGAKNKHSPETLLQASGTAPGTIPPLPNHRGSKYRGVRASGCKWTSQICFDGGTHHLGTFHSEMEAAMAYDQAAHNHHGDAAALNFDQGLEEEILSIKRANGRDFQADFLLSQAIAAAGLQTSALPNPDSSQSLSKGMKVTGMRITFYSAQLQPEAPPEEWEGVSEAVIRSFINRSSLMMSDSTVNSNPDSPSVPMQVALDLSQPSQSLPVELQRVEGGGGGGSLYTPTSPDTNTLEGELKVEEPKQFEWEFDQYRDMLGFLKDSDFISGPIPPSSSGRGKGSRGGKVPTPKTPTPTFTTEGGAGAAGGVAGESEATKEKGKGRGRKKDETKEKDKGLVPGVEGEKKEPAKRGGRKKKDPSLPSESSSVLSDSLITAESTDGASQSPLSSSVPLPMSFPSPSDPSSPDLKGDDDDELGGSSSSSSSAPRDPLLCMPDARTMNRLFTWLLCSDEARLIRENHSNSHQPTHPNYPNLIALPHLNKPNPPSSLIASVSSSSTPLSPTNTKSPSLTFFSLTPTSSSLSPSSPSPLLVKQEKIGIHKGGGIGLGGGGGGGGGDKGFITLSPSSFHNVQNGEILEGVGMINDSGALYSTLDSLLFSSPQASFDLLPSHPVLSPLLSPQGEDTLFTYLHSRLLSSTSSSPSSSSFLYSHLSSAFLSESQPLSLLASYLLEATSTPSSSSSLSSSSSSSISTSMEIEDTSSPSPLPSPLSPPPSPSLDVDTARLLTISFLLYCTPLPPLPSSSSPSSEIYSAIGFPLPPSSSLSSSLSPSSSPVSSAQSSLSSDYHSLYLPLVSSMSLEGGSEGGEGEGAIGSSSSKPTRGRKALPKKTLPSYTPSTPSTSSNSDLSASSSSSLNSSPGPFSPLSGCLGWESFPSLSHCPLLTPQQIQSFYYLHFLPSLLASLASSSSPSQSPSTSPPSPFSLISLLSSPPLSFSPQQISSLSFLYLSRRLLLRSIRYFLCFEPASLLDLLRSREGREITDTSAPTLLQPLISSSSFSLSSLPPSLLSSLPPWWCPWIHDSALLLSLLKHGFPLPSSSIPSPSSTPSFPSIRTDLSLPFHPYHLDLFVRRTFLYGSLSLPPSSLPESSPPLSSASLSLASTQSTTPLPLASSAPSSIGSLTSPSPSLTISSLSPSPPSSSPNPPPSSTSPLSPSLLPLESLANSLSSVFPHPLLLELRAMRVMSLLTGSLSSAHPLTSLSWPSASSTFPSNSSPPLPLSRFLTESYKRRRSVVSLSHPQLLSFYGASVGGGGGGV